MNNNLLKAILALDAYNRGYNTKVTIEGTQVGNATVLKDSSVIVDSNGERLDESADFYAIAYTINSSSGPETLISYRGTDAPWDVVNGWVTGLGAFASTQALMAAEFYHNVIGMQNPMEGIPVGG